MGDVTFRVVPADMEADASKWGSAAESMGQAHRAVPALGVSFGGFQTVIGQTYSDADLAVQNMIEVGAGRLRATSTNVTTNSGRTKKNDDDADKRVGQAGAGGGGRVGGGGPGEQSGGPAGERPSEQPGEQPGGQSGGGKDKNHYTLLLNDNPMPSDPKDPEITFDRHVDEKTGEVTWTPREMMAGEGVATDGRDVERIPARADRIAVTMVDGEPQISYVDRDTGSQPGDKGLDTGGHWEAATEHRPETRIVSGSGAEEPRSQPEAQPRTEWSRALPEGADYAVVEVRDGEPHLVFLDVEGNDVTQVSDRALTERPVWSAKEPLR